MNLDSVARVMKTVLVVDDDPMFRTACGRALLGQRKKPILAEDGETACRMARVERPDFAIVDLRLPGSSGIQVIRDLTREVPPIRIAIVSGYLSIENTVEAMQAGAVTVLGKPITLKEILQRVEASPESTSSDENVPTLSRAVYEHTMRVLNDCEGNVSEAAKKLGTSRPLIYRLLNNPPPL